MSRKSKIDIDVVENLPPKTPRKKKPLNISTNSGLSTARKTTGRPKENAGGIKRSTKKITDGVEGAEGIQKESRRVTSKLSKSGELPIKRVEKKSITRKRSSPQTAPSSPNSQQGDYNISEKLSRSKKLKSEEVLTDSEPDLGVSEEPKDSIDLELTSEDEEDSNLNSFQDPFIFLNPELR